MEAWGIGRLAGAVGAETGADPAWDVALRDCACRVADSDIGIVPLVLLVAQGDGLAGGTAMHECDLDFPVLQRAHAEKIAGYMHAKVSPDYVDQVLLELIEVLEVWVNSHRAAVVGDPQQYSASLGVIAKASDCLHHQERHVRIAASSLKVPAEACLALKMLSFWLIK